MALAARAISFSRDEWDRLGPTWRRMPSLSDPIEAGPGRQWDYFGTNTNDVLTPCACMGRSKGQGRANLVVTIA